MPWTAKARSLDILVQPRRTVIRATSWDFDLRHCGRRDQLDNRNARPRAIASVINPHGSIRILLEDRRKAAIPLVLEFFQEFLSRRDPARDIFLDWLEIPAFVMAQFFIEVAAKGDKKEALKRSGLTYLLRLQQFHDSRSYRGSLAREPRGASEA